MTKKLPRFRDEREEARFWDTHDSADWQAQLEDDVDTVFVRPESGVIELGAATWSRIVREAKRRRTKPTSLVRRWLREKLANAG